jgi:hypothetical protein
MPEPATVATRPATYTTSLHGITSEHSNGNPDTQYR